MTAPKACPFCQSGSVTTTSKEIGVSTYWRCTACGQIWNAGRLRMRTGWSRTGWSR